RILPPGQVPRQSAQSPAFCYTSPPLGVRTSLSKFWLPDSFWPGPRCRDNGRLQGRKGREKKLASLSVDENLSRLASIACPIARHWARVRDSPVGGPASEFDRDDALRARTGRRTWCLRRAR